VEYAWHVVAMIGIFAILSSSLNLLMGHTGILSIAQAAFYGIGAYVSALLTTHLGWPFPLGLASSIVITAFASLIVSIPSIRLKGDFFVMATFAFQMVAFSIFNNWIDLTGGPLGIYGIPPPKVGSWKLDTPFQFAILTTLLAWVVHMLAQRIVTSPFGRVLHGIREDESFVASIGKNVIAFKITIFAVSAAEAGLAGSLFAHYITYIDPKSFTMMDSVLVISMVIIGGAGNPSGSLLGALLLVVLPEALRFLGMSGSYASNVQEIIYGTLLVLLMMFRPRGMLGRFSFEGQTWKH